MDKQELTKTEHQSLDMQASLVQMSNNSNIDPDKLQKLWELQIQVEDRQNKKAYSKAMAQFQRDCPIIRKTKKVNFPSKTGRATKYNYSPLDEIVHMAKPLLGENGLSFSFNIKKTDDKNQDELVTTIMHADGHCERFSYYFVHYGDDQRMNQSQRAKSALTYSKRAALENALGIVTAEEDDDARRAIDCPASDEQIESIKKMLISTDSDETKFLNYLRVESLDFITQSDAKKALFALNQKANR